MKFLPFAIILFSLPRLQAFGAFQIQAGVDWWTPLLIFLGLMLIVAVALIINTRQSTAEMVSAHVGVEDEAHTEIAAALPQETPELPPDLVTEPATAISEKPELLDAEGHAATVETEALSQAAVQAPSAEIFESEPVTPEEPIDHPAPPTLKEDNLTGASGDSSSPMETNTPPVI